MLSIIKKLCFFFQVYNSHFYLCSELKELKDEAYFLEFKIIEREFSTVTKFIMI